MIKVLWIVNMVMPDLASHLGIETGSSGTWMFDLSKRISGQPGYELAVACVWGDSFRCEEVSGIKYYLLPGSGKNMLFYTKKYEDMWKRVCNKFHPDIVHIHGTEYSHGLSFLRSCPEVPAVISVQGLLCRIKDVDLGGVPLRHLFFGRTARQNLHLNGELEMHLLHRHNAEHETEMLRRAGYANVVNTWDESVCLSINPNLKTYRIEYNLRNELYESRKWNPNLMEPHAVFTNPGGTPLKGLHRLVEAIALLRSDYPDVKVRVPGMGHGGRIEVTSAYSKYVAKLIRKNELEGNFEFLGCQNGREMCANMLKSNVVVIPSAIEGTSLILREAMFLGCPVAASFRGGMADFVSDKVDGYLYDYNEPAYLAMRLRSLFEDRELCMSFSKRAIEKASCAHDRQTNVANCLKMYRDILLKGSPSSLSVEL